MEHAAKHRERAAVAYTLGEIDKAEASLKIILAMLPDDLDALNFLGHIERTRGNLGAAENRQKQPYERMS